MKRAVKINAEIQTIEEIHWETINDLKKHIGGNFEAIATPDLNGDIVLVDEEGLYKDVSYGFYLKGYSHVFVLAGNGIVIKMNEKEFAETNIDILCIEDNIRWVEGFKFNKG